MSLLMVTVSAAIALQSLGEVAEREKKRRERNAEAGVEAVSFTGTGSAIEPTNADGEGEGDDDASPASTVASSWTDDEASPLEAERLKGDAFVPRMEEIAAAADGVDRLYNRYMDRCHNRYLVGETPPGIGVPMAASHPVHVEAGRNWFVVLDAPSATSTTVSRSGGGNIILVQTVECQELWQDIVDAAMAIKQSMRQLLADARRDGVLPGVIRELRREYNLEWSGWER